MKTFTEWYKNVSGEHELPRGNIPYKWFLEKNLPMIVKCSCCDSTMILFNSYVDENDYTFCPSCAEISE